MSPNVTALLYWSPRLAGLGVVILLSLLALDAFDGRPLEVAFPSFIVHLAPAAVCATVVVLSWRRPRAGAALFAVLAIGYALSVPSRPDWIAVVSGPLAVVAMLFAISPRRQEA